MPVDMRLPTAEDLLVWVQSEKMHLTLKRLEAPGSLEVWWGGGMEVGTCLRRWGLGGEKEVCDVEQLEGRLGRK